MRRRLLLVGIVGISAAIGACRDSVPASGQSDVDAADDQTLDWTWSPDVDAERLDDATDARPDGGEDAEWADSDRRVDVEVDDGVAQACFDLDSYDTCEAIADCRWLAPPCQDEPEPAAITDGGCFADAECASDADCGAGALCAVFVVNPCFNMTCGVCSSETTACAPSGGFCGGEPLEAAFDVTTAVEPTDLGTDRYEWVLEGTVTYNGPGPLTGDYPDGRYDHELDIRHDDGTYSTIVYGFPLEPEIPVGEGWEVTITHRVQNLFEGHVEGLVVSRSTSGLHPLMFVAELGAHRGLRLFEDDPLIAPLQVRQEDDMDCPVRPDPACGGRVYSDRLVFDSSTGAAIVETDLYRGERGTLDIFGEPFSVIALESSRIEPTCPDDSRGGISYLAVRQMP